MNQPSSSPQSDANSAVVINQDGKIEYHIADEYDKDKHQVDGADVAAKTVIIENELVPLEASKSIGNLLEQMRYSRFIPYFILILLLIILLMAQQIYLNNLNKTKDIHTQSTLQSSEVPQESPAVTEIKFISKLLYDEDELSLSVLQLFNEKWQRLDVDSKQLLMGSFWFGRFSELLQKKIESQQAMMKASLDSSDFDNASSSGSLKNDIIAETATIIGMQLPGYNSTEQHVDDGIDEIFQAISTEIAKVEAEKIASTVDDIKIHEDHSTEAKSSHGFYESDANYLLGQYVATYEFGKTKRLLSYFSANRKYRQRLKTSFKKVFKQSSVRRIIFSDLQWTFNENSIIGNGKYQATITLKNNNGTRYVNADIKVKLKPKKESLKISRMEFFNVDVDLKEPATVKKRQVVAKQEPKFKLRPAPTSPRFASTRRLMSREIPTTAELQDIMSRFALAYESGNISELESIFSKDIKTNDKNSLTDVKQDYVDLFNNTTDRQLFIEELNWSIVNDRATGEGKLSVLLISQNSSKISTQHGEIHIVAKKTNHKTLITSMYHHFHK